MNNTNMLHKALMTILVMTGKSGFEKYLSSVQARFDTGVPTRDEARRDFETVVQCGNFAALSGEGSF